MRAAVFGLGEAGSLISADLAAAGVDVRGFDPAPVATPPGVDRHADPTSAVAGAEVVIALTAAGDAMAALTQALDAIGPGALYADLSTSAAGAKRRLAGVAADAGLDFADVAMMSIVPGNGLRVPALVSGPGADRFVAAMAPLGMPVTSIGGEAGDAATRKLTRSVMMKGLAAVVIESLRAGEAAGCVDWLWANLRDELAGADGRFLARLVQGTGQHAIRRLHEMEAARDLLDELGVDPLMTRSTIESLRRTPIDGVPTPPPPG
jgi:3-hydroxyisobutyrate dehydrogenase-like beta-hydroxyacid dehydrogenase